MYIPIDTTQGFEVMGTAFAALVAIIGDYYTSMIGMQHGFVEGNPINRWLFSKISQPLTVFLEAAGICWAGAFLTDYGAHVAEIFFGGVAIAEGIRALLNYKKLKAAKISLL